MQVGKPGVLQRCAKCGTFRITYRHGARVYRNGDYVHVDHLYWDERGARRGHAGICDGSNPRGELI